MQHFRVFVDEAGDDGFGKLATASSGGQSRWLMLGACIVAMEHDARLPAWRNAIMARFPNKQSRDLHFRNLKHDQKVVVCQEIARLPLSIGLVMANKATIPGTRYANAFKGKGELYAYLIRRLIERVFEECRALCGYERFMVQFMFSRRGNMDRDWMLAYFRSLREGTPDIKPLRRVDWRRIPEDQVLVEDHPKWAGLQFADCITSAFFNALEPNIYGNYETSYAFELGPKLIRNSRWAASCGIVMIPPRVPSKLDTRQHDFFDKLGYKRQAPDP